MPREHYESLLKQLDEQVLTMGHLVSYTIGTCIDALEQCDVVLAQRLIEADSRIDEQRYEIEQQAFLLIATQQPTASDLRLVTAALTIATELERIGDYCEGIAKLTLRMAAEPAVARGPIITDIHVMADMAQQLLCRVLKAFADRDLKAAGNAWIQDDDVDQLYQQVFQKVIGDMAADKATIRRGTYLLWVAHNLERMTDRVTNIAERVAFIVTGNIAAFREELRAQRPPA
jgi:phosphate transport system protein